MKRTLPLLLAAALAAGCASQPDARTACDTARQAYQVYLADRELRAPSPDEIRWAQAAALFLQLQCGWTAPAARAADGPPVDAHGVPILVPPM